jgi:RHS repeat-associated protein
LYRFSSKETHPTSGLVYNLYRYYEAGVQRWANRDPVEELGFTLLKSRQQPNPTVDLEDDPSSPRQPTELNLYGFVDNRPTGEVDPFGLFLGFGYGNWCGYSRSGQGGDPIDGVDEACQTHDLCLATWADACKFKFCNVRFCKDVAKAKCYGDKACKKAKRKILIGCALIVPIPPFIFM